APAVPLAASVARVPNSPIASCVPLRLSSIFCFESPNQRPSASRNPGCDEGGEAGACTGAVEEVAPAAGDAGDVSCAGADQLSKSKYANTAAPTPARNASGLSRCARRLLSLACPPIISRR